MSDADDERERDLIGRARALALIAHLGQKDKAGRPYIDHPARVARRVAETAPPEIRERAVVVAWLHDSVEDTGYTLDHLRRLGFDEEIVDGVDSVTKRPGETLRMSMTRAGANRIGKVVKDADIDDNSDPERLALLDPDTRGRLKIKYERSRRFLHA